MENIKLINDWIETAQLICTKTDGKTKYHFNKFTLPLKFATKIYHHDLTLQEAKNNQEDFEILINKLNNDYNPRKNQIKLKEKDDTLKSAKKLFIIRGKITNAFSEGIFPYIDGFQAEKESDEETDKELDTKIIPELESEESAAERWNQEGEGVKILTPNQLLSRLPISLAQLKAGNNSEKLRNEIRQLLCSLYR